MNEKERPRIRNRRAVASGLLAICARLCLPAEAIGQPANAPVIEQFSVSSPTIFEGRLVTLRWRTRFADQTWIIPNDWSGSGMVSKPDNTVASSGRLRIRPEKSTVYTLIARNAAGEVTRMLEVRVASEEGTCTISGRLDGDRSEYDSRVNLHRAGSETVVAFVPVKDGVYTFENVNAGNYRLVPVGKYPNDRLSLGPKPRSRDLTCRRNQRHHVNFAIVSWEGRLRRGSSTRIALGELSPSP